MSDYLEMHRWKYQASLDRWCCEMCSAQETYEPRRDLSGCVNPYEAQMRGAHEAVVRALYRKGVGRGVPDWDGEQTLLLCGVADEVFKALGLELKAWDRKCGMEPYVPAGLEEANYGPDADWQPLYSLTPRHELTDPPIQ